MALEIEDASVTYRANFRRVIDFLSFSAKGGEITSILGPTGSGKTTLILAIAGLLNRDEVEVSGRLCLNATAHPLPVSWDWPVSIAFQQPVFLPWLTVFDNIASLHEAQRERHFNPEETVRRVHKYLELMDLCSSANLRPYQLSGGMQGRANLARALSFQSDLLLLDEPFANLDEIMKDRVAAVVSDHTADQGTTTIMVTHNIRDAVSASEAIYILSGEPLNTATLWCRPAGSPDLEKMHEEVRLICARRWYRST